MFRWNLYIEDKYKGEAHQSSYCTMTEPPKATALVITCSDNRFQKNFRNLIEGPVNEGNLGIPVGMYFPLTLLGSIRDLMEPEREPQSFEQMKRSLSFFFTQFPAIQDIVIISHTDCLAYKALQKRIGSEFLGGHQDLAARQKADLCKAKEIISTLRQEPFRFHLFLNINIDNKSAGFEKVE